MLRVYELSHACVLAVYLSQALKKFSWVGRAGWALGCPHWMFGHSLWSAPPPRPPIPVIRTKILVDEVKCTPPTRTSATRVIHFQLLNTCALPPSPPRRNGSQDGVHPRLCGALLNAGSQSPPPLPTRTASSVRMQREPVQTMVHSLPRAVVAAV